MTRAAALPDRIHAVGVGGGGLAPLARLLAARGHEVSGSDRTARPDLRAAGLAVHEGHAAEHLGSAQLVVRSAAVPDANPEIAAARARDVPVLRYSEALGALMGERAGVAIAGTHGKTTTTALVAHLLRAVGADPGWIVGGRPRSLPAAWGWGDGAHFVAEACEFGLSFLDLPYRIGALTGVTADHLDCFGDLAGVEQAFAQFLARAPADGSLVLAREVPAAVRAAIPAGVPAVELDEALPLLELGEDDAGFHGRVGVGARALPFDLPVLGRHNVDLARLAVAVALQARPDADPEALLAALSDFTGVHRRLEDLGEREGLAAGGPVRLVDDFAHHPEAVAAAAEALAGRFPDRRRVAIFQPHQVSRTEDFLAEFVQALGAFDVVALCDIFVARDAHPERADEVLAALAAALGERAQVVGPARGAADRVCSGLVARDVCVVMGAGDVEQLAVDLAGRAARP